MSGPSLPTIKRLFAVSGNYCAFEGCKNNLVDFVSGKVIGRICHIKAQSPGGPRFDSNQTDQERHSFDNLILLCPIHHDVIDSNPLKYDVGFLLQLKSKLEKAHHNDGTLPNDDIAKQFQVTFNRRERLIANIRSELRDNLISLVTKSDGKINPYYFWLNQTRKERALTLDDAFQGFVNLPFHHALGCYYFCTSFNTGNLKVHNKELQNAISSGEFLQFDPDLEQFLAGSFQKAMSLLSGKIDRCRECFRNTLMQDPTGKDFADFLLQLNKKQAYIKVSIQFIAYLYRMRDIMEDIVTLSKLLLLHSKNPVFNFSIPSLNQESPIGGPDLSNTITHNDIDNWVSESFEAAEI